MAPVPVTKLGMRKIVEEALEAEVADALGRGYCERGLSRRAIESVFRDEAGRSMLSPGLPRASCR